MRVGIEPFVAPSRSPGHATKLARQAIEYGSDLVLVLGGDGTINEVACGMTYASAALGILPAGTANVLAMEMKLGSTPETAAASLAKAVQKRIALGCLETAEGPRYFLCMAGAGVDARIVAQVSPRLKAAWGKAAYWLTASRQSFGRVEQLEVEIAGKRYQCGFALTSRVANYGGDMEIARGASLARNDFEVVLFEGSNPLRYLYYMLGVGLDIVQQMRGVTTLAAADVRVLSGVDMQIDGEYAGRAPARLTIVPDALTLLMPPG